PPRSFVVVTAENELQIDSVRDRMLTLYSDDGGGFINPASDDPLGTLNAMSRRGDQARLSAQMLRWMTGLAARSSYEQVRAMFVRERDDSASDARQHVERELGSQVNATRHSQIISEYQVCVLMLEEYALSLGMDNTGEADLKLLDRISDMADDRAAQTADPADRQPQREPEAGVACGSGAARRDPGPLRPQRPRHGPRRSRVLPRCVPGRLDPGPPSDPGRADGPH